VNSKPRLLDLFCCDGGASVGYARAGFEVTGVDIRRRKFYPYEFIKADVRDVLRDVSFLRSFDAIAASPPCPMNSRTQHLRNAQGKQPGALSQNMIPEVREALQAIDLPYVIENVEGADMKNPITLCGSMFPELHVYDETGRRWLKRHRLFESNLRLESLMCNHAEAGVRPLGVYGSMRDNIPSGGQTVRSIAEAQKLMGIDWIPTWSGIKEAIPPAYTEYLGSQLIRYV
jgi:DNA (cytosine-5)-methyltransferase 1